MKKTMFSLLLAILFLSCKKDHRDTLCLNGTIEWHGQPEADGLGWVLKSGQESTQVYVLRNLPSDFQQDGLAVNACLYDTGEKAPCLCTKNYFETTTIRRR